MAAPSKSRPSTRERLLDAAQAGINREGFAATSIERIIEQAGVTKGTFFYHFASKNDLARALMERYAAADREMLESSLARAEHLSDDPLQQLLVFVGLMIEVAEMLDEIPEPGSLFASYCWESGLFDDPTRALVTDALTRWRGRVGERLRAAAETRPLTRDVDLDSLADMLTALFEGAFVIARSTPSRAVFAGQLRHYRTYLQLLFGA